MKAKQLEQEWRRYAKWQRQNRMKPCTLEQFQRYVRGGGLGEKPQFQDYKPPVSAHESRMRANQAIPSRFGDSLGVCGRKESPRYTGDYVKGISTMHKSNAVPVVDDEHIKDMARMRR